MELLCTGSDQKQLVVTVADLLKEDKDALGLFVLLTKLQVCCWTMHVYCSSLWMHVYFIDRYAHGQFAALTCGSG